MLWTKAEARKDAPLAQAIRLAAYTGARIEGVTKLRVSDIRTDPETQIRFMRMADKTQAGDRDVPIHPAIEPLIARLIQDADTAGFLVHTTAKNKYGERSQPMGKRFGRMKTASGYDERHVFHSIRYTVAKMFQDAGCAEGVAADIVGHLKPGLTFGFYGGITAMKLRYGGACPLHCLSNNGKRRVTRYRHHLNRLHRGALHAEIDGRSGADIKWWDGLIATIIEQRWRQGEEPAPIGQGDLEYATIRRPFAPAMAEGDARVCDATGDDGHGIDMTQPIAAVTSL